MVRTELAEYRSYEINITEWLGRWQASVYPLAPGLRLQSDEQVIAAASLDETMAQARKLVDRLIDPPR